MREVNGAIFQTFVKQAKAHGAIPILVHFPSWMTDSDALDYTPFGVKILRAAGLDYLDPTDCLTPIPFPDRVMPGRHMLLRVTWPLRNAFASQWQNNSPSGTSERTH